MIEYILESAVLEDVDSIKKFLIAEYEINKQIPEEATPDFFALTENGINEILNYLPESINDSEVIFLLLKDEKGKIYGWGQIVPHSDEPGEAEMSSLYITKDLRRFGWGDRMLKQLVNKTQERGYSRLCTLLQVSNVGASRFLQNEGFKKTEIIELESEMFTSKMVKVYKFVKDL